MLTQNMETIETVLQPELLPGERLLWSGRPAQSWVPRLRDAMTIPVGLVWGVIAVSFVFGALTDPGENAPLLLCGLPFGLAALGMIVLPFVSTVLARRRTFYGLTNQRLLIVSTVWRRHVRALNLRTLSEVQLSTRADGRGTLTFGAPGQMFGALPNGWPWATRFGPAMFENIPQAREVYQHIHAAQARLLGG
jgi:hypothetical protein